MTDHAPTDRELEALKILWERGQALDALGIAWELRMYEGDRRPACAAPAWR